MTDAAPPLTRPPIGIVRLVAGFYGVVLLFAFGYTIFAKDLPLGRLFGVAPSPEGLLAGVGVGLVIVGVVRLGYRMWSAIEDAARVLSVMVGPLTTKQAILIGIISGVAEELLFRGALWDHLGLGGTTCLFALVHVIFKRELWGYPLFAAGAGLIFGVLRQGSDSVFPPMLAHVTVNCINLVWLAKRYPTFVRQDSADRIAQETDGR